MRIAYVFSTRFWKQDGVSKKIQSQMDIWRKLGHEVEGFCLTPYSKRDEELNGFDFRKTVFNKSRFSLVNNTDTLSRFKKCDQLASSLNTYSPDVIYFRFETYKPFFTAIFASKAKKIMEINTIDVIENRILARSRLFNRLIQIYSNLTRHKIFGRVDKLVSITDEIANHSSIKKFNKPSRSIPNPINLASFREIKKQSEQPNKGSLPTILFIGSTGFPWFGVDLLLNLARKTESKLKFLLVGDLSIEQDLPSNVDCRGYLKNDELQKAVAACDIAISSLALFRYGLNEAATLKVREYLAWGLPLILCHNDSAFKEADPFPDWILQLPNTETGASENIDKIIEFCDKNRSTCVPRLEVERFLDMNRLEKSRLDFFVDND